MSSPEEVQRIFLAALEAERNDREKILFENCSGNSALRREVEELLEAHSVAGSFMSPIFPEATSSWPLAKPGDRIGEFELVTLIGQGGFGQVFLGKQQSPVRRNVAIKLIRPEMASPEVLARFAAEQQVLAIMDHPNIAKVIKAGTTVKGQPYCVMELVDGIPITEYCDRHRLSTSERVELLMRTCSAIQHAHQRGIIHRDLKPGNILVADRDGQHVPKIIDFGVAKSIGQEHSALNLTSISQLIGTPLYMSPEQACQSRDVDSRSDVFSLGVVLYELLTGSTPLEQSTLSEAPYLEVCKMVCEEPAPKPSDRISGSGDSLRLVAEARNTPPHRLSTYVKGDLDWIVLKAIEKDRERRYQTPAEFAEDLKRFLNHEPVEARPPSTNYRIRKFVRKNRAVCAAIAAVMVILLAATAFSIRKDKIADQKLKTVESLTEVLLGSFRLGIRGGDVTVPDILSNVYNGIKDQLPDEQYESKLKLMDGAADAARGLLLYEIEESVLNDTVDLRTKFLGPDHPSTKSSRYRLLKCEQNLENQQEENDGAENNDANAEN